MAASKKMKLTEEVKADTKEVKADTNEVKADTKEVKADTKKVKADTKKVKADTKEVNADTKEVVNTEEVATINTQFGDMLSKIVAMSGQFSAMKIEFKALEKRFQRELKLAQKKTKGKKSDKIPRSPSGFVKPTRISEELAIFLEKPLDIEMARTEVTREINAYIRLHHLQDKINGRIILPDERLKKLLKIKEDEQVTYFNLQRFMSPHFPKSVIPVPSAV
jgi:chromatin remodeling complex protein RSC6